MTEKATDMARKDWTLLVIAAGRGQPLSPVQLQKVLFLLGQEHPSVLGSDYYDFVPYDYGPFSIVIYTDAKQLDFDGFISIQYAPNHRWKVYSATPDGLSRSEELRKKVDDQVIQFIDNKVEWGRQLSFRALVREIHKKYPAFAVNSVFQN